MNKFNLLSEVEDDYSTDEMVPEEVDEAATEEPVEAGESTADDVVENENVSEVTAMKARMALLEAIVDQAVEDVVEESAKEGTDEAEVKDEGEDAKDDDSDEKSDDADDDDSEDEDETVDTEKATAVATELIDKAIALHYVPSSFKKRIPAIVARHLKINDPKMALYAKAATFFTAAMTDEVITADGEKDTIAEAVDASPADLGDSIEKTQEFEGDNKQEGGETETNADDAPAPKAKKSKLKASLEGFLNPFMEGVTADAEPDTVDEVLDTKPVEADDISVTEEFDGDNAQEGGETETNADDAPEAPKASVAMKTLARAIINRKKATRDVSVAVSGRMLDKMLHELRYQLPAKFVRKYKVR